MNCPRCPETKLTAETRLAMEVDRCMSCDGVWLDKGEAKPAARGASFLYPIRRIARATHRLKPRPDYRGEQLGFRLVKDTQ